ncbi:His-Xaa-Ser repeat protein HxsA2 [Cupriavidus sp. CV2]|uniref:His-Xaa-Ser repeat protein HxsA2 n=1 Tax=Cupriavidus ulmosensis TaxID=3065913 RepID=UPI00296AB2BE|nr:His-Xaa-Ser repeat protein HxsA2 [Cupriavidus sp. CV2]MDW3687611.1 His-Xaa-Ser repeat protein HxsA2 [Cupriavidus sp. CV2]
MKGFLKAFAVVAAGFAAQNASAIQAPAQAPSVTKDTVASVGTQTSDKIAVHDASGDAFNFVLKRATEDGKLMAWHESHASHRSHSSHYSSR